MEPAHETVTAEKKAATEHPIELTRTGKNYSKPLSVNAGVICYFDPVAH